jgi:hypothetical protein
VEGTDSSFGKRWGGGRRYKLPGPGYVAYVPLSVVPLLFDRTKLTPSDQTTDSPIRCKNFYPGHLLRGGEDFRRGPNPLSAAVGTNYLHIDTAHCVRRERNTSGT